MVCHPKALNGDVELLLLAVVENNNVIKRNIFYVLWVGMIINSSVV